MHKASLPKKIGEEAATHTMWWAIGGDKLLDKAKDKAKEWVLEHCKKVMGSSVLSTIGVWWSHIQWHLAWQYLSMIGMGIFAMVLFVWDVSAGKRKNLKGSESTAETCPDETLSKTTIKVEEPLLELRKTAEFGQRVESWAWYPLILTNIRRDYPAPAIGIRASLHFEHVKGRLIEVSNGIFLNRNESKFVHEIDELRNGEEVELIVVATPYGQEFFAMRSYPQEFPSADKFTEGEWECRITISGSNLQSFSRTYRFTVWTGQALSLQPID